jgi:hypothetical protein
MAGRKISDSQWHDIVRRRDAGEPVKLLAKEYGVVPNHIYNYLSTRMTKAAKAAKATRKAAPTSVDIQLQPASDGIVTIIRTDVHTARALLMGESWK